MKIKKQYHYTIYRAKAEIDLYHDGKKKNTISVWLTELDETLYRLEAEGYAVGYMRDEVIAARDNYLRLRKNMIQKQGLWIYSTDEEYVDCPLCVTALDPIMDAMWIEDHGGKWIGYASNREEAWTLLTPYINDKRILCTECDLEDIADSETCFTDKCPLKKYPDGYARSLVKDFIESHWPE